MGGRCERGRLSDHASLPDYSDRYVSRSTQEGLRATDSDWTSQELGAVICKHQEPWEALVALAGSATSDRSAATYVLWIRWKTAKGANATQATNDP